MAVTAIARSATTDRNLGCFTLVRCIKCIVRLLNPGSALTQIGKMQPNLNLLLVDRTA
jgi:hypothetical protein